MPEETLAYSRFGTVTVYRPPGPPSRVALFVSGDGGWNLGVVDMARALVAEDTLVIGIDIRRYLASLESASEKCSYPAADFEGLSHFVQKKLDLPRYFPPVLVGYSSGATLVYAIAAQAPPGTFRAAISMGFCPDLPLTHPLCRGSGLAWKPGPHGKGFSFLPARSLGTEWIAFQGTIDRVCDAAAVQSFVKEVGPSANLVLLPKVGHGFSIQRNWMPQLRAAFTSSTESPPVARPLPDDIRELPVVEVPSVRPGGDTLAVLVSGDGGWAGLDRGLSASLSEQGIPVVGLDSLQYFWRARSPEESGKDLDRLLRHYLRSWGKTRAILIGYSLGADVLPFLARRLSPEMLARVSRIALLGPGRQAEFEFHVTDWLVSSKSGRPVLPEVEELRGPDMVCVYGVEEEGSLCPALDPKRVRVVSLSGGHHFDGNYTALARVVLEPRLESPSYAETR
jgi:type IV secretory pathway VirJ component